MTRLHSLAASVLLFGACNGSVNDGRQPRSHVPTYEFMNGRWFTGAGFVETTMYSSAGVLHAERPSEVDSTIDLAGEYVVPAFGEAHTHRPASPNGLESSVTGFLVDGIYYVMNHGSLARYRQAFDSAVNHIGSIDSRFAHVLVASPQSHGVALWQRLIDRGAFPGVDVQGLDGDAYVIVESSSDIDRRWTDVLGTKPDFIKIMVEHSEEYELRRADPLYFGQSGLDPALVPEIVARARDAGLRVSAHIETAADFHVVVEAGVDIVAHLPGYDVPNDQPITRYRIDPSDAARAAAQGITVVTTIMLSVDRAEDEPRRLERMDKNHRGNLTTLIEAGVALAVGSDQFSTNAVDEALRLASLGVLDNATILTMLCQVTPKVIFPERRIGTLTDGDEANFLVLSGNPLENLSHIRDITLRVKDGELLRFELTDGS